MACFVRWPCVTLRAAGTLFRGIGPQLVIPLFAVAFAFHVIRIGCVVHSSSSSCQFNSPPSLRVC